MNRRQMLRMTGLAGVGLLAGCVRLRPDAPDTSTPGGAAGPSQERGRATRPRPHAAAPEEDAAAADRPEPLPDPDPDADLEQPPEPEPGADLEPDPDPAAAPPRVEVICRHALGLTAAAAATTSHRLERVTLHHTAVELGANHHAPARLRGHQRYHLDQGWVDVAYHYAVDLRGNVYELRDPDQPGDTFTDYDPSGHLLVVCEGNYDLEQPSEAMLDGIAALLAAAADTHGVDPATLTGHRDHASLSCPGDALQARLPDLRDVAAARRRDRPAELVTVCGEDAERRVARIEAGEHEETHP